MLGWDFAHFGFLEIIIVETFSTWIENMSFQKLNVSNIFTKNVKPNQNDEMEINQ